MSNVTVSEPDITLICRYVPICVHAVGGLLNNVLLMPHKTLGVY